MWRSPGAGVADHPRGGVVARTARGWFPPEGWGRMLAVMTDAAVGTGDGVTTRPSVLPPHLSAKFALPAAPAAMVFRQGLAERLDAAARPQVVSVVAAAGYGKTTLLRQWAERLPSMAYVAIDERDSDPVLLVSCIAASLDRVEGLDPAVLRLIRSPGQSLESTLLPSLVEALWARRTPTVLMLDDLHRLDGTAALDVIAFLMLRLPPSLGLVLASRRSVPLPFARLRVAGHLLELGAPDLVLDASAAQAMAAVIGLAVSPDDVVKVLDRTEGWPAATYLGLRSYAAAQVQERPTDDLLGSEASIADYMRSELLEPLDADTQRWLLRSSVLDVMSGPLCDAALETSGSLALLRQLERNNLFVIALDSHHGTYRYHHLFRDFLRDELDVREPGAAAEACARAATWCVQHDEPENAVAYAHTSGDMDLVAGLVMAYSFPMHWSGRMATVARWLGWFDRDGERERRAAFAILAGWVHTMEGRTREARRWLGIAMRSPDPGPMPDGASKEAWIALLHGCMAPSGMQTLRSDARIGLAGIGEDSPFRQTALTLAGFSAIADGSLDSADALLSEAADLSEARRAVPGMALALGERAVIALARGDVASARQHVERGLTAVRDAGMEDEVLSMVLHAAAARTAVLSGLPADGRLAIARVNRMRPRVTEILPIPALQMRFETIRAYLALNDASAARTLLAEVRTILRACPDLGTLVQEASELEQRVASMRESSAGPWTLTAAELRLLAYLPTHLSFREIAERLYVSPHTVKTQAMAVYGKLGVATRRGAIEQAVEAGLLDSSVIRMPGVAGGIA